ncbi:MAG: ribose 5-phosphate isomerase B [Alphaproteobacteria bacterium]|jgi:ribose 5-phosphate isomerase B|nr:ribose 5-phosphate isomerase B [Alphaproteobacteria bacterium]|tara:strand:- start:4218 stop:4655 length:438 start_codon:yes stop_codon:yes gene_type:complete
MAKILIASDHAGFHLKEELKKHFTSEHEFIDFGPNSSDSVDYPDYAHILSQKISESKDSFGILICGSGIGMSMVANRYKDVRAALCLNEKMAQLSREHNNANVLVLGSRLISCEEAIKCLIMFFKSKFEGNRHQARLDKFNDVKM